MHLLPCQYKKTHDIMDIFALFFDEFEKKRKNNRTPAVRFYVY